ncbi:dentin sialophosphoprotein-like [Heteronotia binoei]|uniref:dentin sialophosphoprotein-like n=1 Tax=Heteronotia binoei TaxID=13085 RepID=UPI002931AB52|nr:dentin sialophosphoprotein-like [Heteronotia binoei]
MVEKSKILKVSPSLEVKVSHNERSCTGDNKDVSAASNVSEHDAVKNSQEYFEHQNAKKASGNTSLTSEGHGGARSEDSRIKESHATASLVVGAADFVDGNGNGGGKTKPNLSKIPGSKRNKAANGNGAGGESINGNIEDGVFGSSPNGTGRRNVHDTSQAELSRLDQNDKKCSDREKAASRNKVGDRRDDTVGSHSNQVQSLASTNVGVPERREPADHTSLKFMRNKVYGESIQWTDMNEGASGHGGDTSEEGSTDGWSDGNSEDTKDLGANETEMHGARSKSQAHDSTGIASPNNGGDGDRSSLDDSLSTSEEDSSQQDNSMSVEKDETVELCDKAKKNEYISIQKKRSGLPVLKGIGDEPYQSELMETVAVNHTAVRLRMSELELSEASSSVLLRENTEMLASKRGKNGHKKKGMAGNRGDLNEKRTVLPDDRKAIGGLSNTNRSQGAYKHRNKPREDSRDISNEDESNNSYSFSDEFMQGDSPNDSHESEGSENSEQDEAESTSKDASDERSKSNGGDSDSQPHSSETEDVSQSASSENKPGSGDTKSDSSSESEGKPASSESKSDSSNESESERDSSKSNSSSESKSESSEGKSDSSSEGKSDSSSESKSESSEGKSDSSSEGKSDSSSESKSESSEGKSDSSSESKSESSEGKSDSSSENKSESTEGKSDGSTESKSESSEGKSDNSNESKSDSSGSKSVSSEGKSDNSSESKSDSSSESKSDSSSESKSDSSSESKSDSSDGSSEGNSDSSSDTKTDSSSESKSESSEGKSSSSSEGKSSSSSEGKSGSSSESNSSGESENSQSSSRAVSSEKDTQSSTNNDASDESKSNESESQSASYSDSGMVSMSDESGADGSDVTDTAENTSDSESAESKESDGDSPFGSVDSESESISEGSESNDSTSDY